MQTSRLTTNALSLLFTVVLLCSCQSKPSTLYQQLGGEPGVEQLVDGLIVRIGEDQQLFHYFAQAKISQFRQGLISHFCAISDGPCHYQGDNLVDIHTGMHITEADFNRLVELLIAQMDAQKISTPAQNRLLAKLAPLRGEVYQR